MKISKQISNPKSSSEYIQLFITIASIIYLCLHISQSHTKPVLMFITTLFVLYFLFKVPSYIAFFFALLISYFSFDIYFIPQIDNYIKNYQESFVNDDKDPKPVVIVDPKTDNDDDESDDKKIHVDSSKSSKTSKSDVDNISPGNLNIPQTITDALSKFTPDQIESMATETKDLVNSQQQLVKTLSQLAPIVENGMKLMENFGGDKKGAPDMLAMFQKMSQKEKNDKLKK
jgi:hypothetical protein